MPQIVNWDILANPLNWVIVALMLAIAVFGLNLIMGGGVALPSGLSGL